MNIFPIRRTITRKDNFINVLKSFYNNFLDIISQYILSTWSQKVGRASIYSAREANSVYPAYSINKSKGLKFLYTELSLLAVWYISLGFREIFEVYCSEPFYNTIAQ